MSTQLDRPGTFRGTILEHVVNATRNGFPQWIPRIAVAEKYDADADAFEDWSQYDQEITGYVVLFGKNGPCLNHQQVQAATGWDGQSFAALNDLDLTDKPLLFRVEESEYNDQTQLKVNWVDAPDAPPIRGLAPLDKKGLADLDKKFAAQAPPKAAKAPATAGKGAPIPPPRAKRSPQAKPKAAAADPTPAPGAEPTTPAPTAPSPSEPPAVSDVLVPAADPTGALDAGKAPATSAPSAEPTSAPTAEATNAAAPPSEQSELPPPAASDAPAPAPAVEHKDVTDKETAWASVETLKRDDVTDKQARDAWIDACCAVAGVEDPNEVDEKTFTAEDWVKVRDLTLDEIPHSPF